MTNSADPTEDDWDDGEEVERAPCFDDPGLAPAHPVPAVDNRAEPWLRRQMGDFVMLLGIRTDGRVAVLRRSAATGEVVGSVPNDTPPGTIIEEWHERHVVTRSSPDCQWRKIGGTWVRICT